MIVLFIFLLALGLIIFRQLQRQLDPTPNSGLNTVTINLNRIPYQLEIAQTDSQRAAGLSNRPSLCTTCGMIFVFDVQSIYPFWMKDTLIPLDMLWLNSDSAIVTILTAVPEPGTPLYQLKLYKNETPARYVIELNAGDSQKLGLKVGDQIDLSSLKIKN